MQKPPSPELIFDAITAYQRSAVMKAAIELDIFTAIGEGATTTGLLAERLKASERGVRILADYLVVIGLLTKSGSTYGLTPDTATFLDKRSRAYMGSISTFLLHPLLAKGFDDVSGAVRKGGTVVEQNSTVAENPVWVEFARGMAPMMIMPAQFIGEVTGAAKGEKWKVLDVAAGHGMFGITLAQQNPNAEIVALDWPAVLAVAEENAQKFGVGGRFRKLAGDAMSIEFGEGYDLVLITNFLHHFDVRTCEHFLRKVHRALKPGGRAVTLEFVPNEDRVSPPPAALFSMVMLAGTPGGDAYTFSELDSMFRNAGFGKSELHAVPMAPEHVIVSEKT
jgi:SAM-dependent methyltransferase